MHPRYKTTPSRPARAQAHQPFEKLQAIHAVHNIQRQHIRIELFDRFGALGASGASPTTSISGKLLIMVASTLRISGEIIYDQYTNFGKAMNLNVLNQMNNSTSPATGACDRRAL